MKNNKNLDLFINSTSISGVHTTYDSGNIGTKKKTAAETNIRLD